MSCQTWTSVQTLGDAQVFSSRNANSCYWKLEVSKEGREKTAFNSPHALYQFLRIPHGLKNEPATFQRMMDVISSTVRQQYLLVNSDDVVILSKTSKDHVEHTKLELCLLKDAGCTLKLDKCAFLTNRMAQSVHEISPDKLEVAIYIADAIRHLKVPITVTVLRSFVGLCTILR